MCSNDNKLWSTVCTPISEGIRSFLVSNRSRTCPTEFYMILRLAHSFFLPSLILKPKSTPTLPWRLSPGSASSKRMGDSVYLKIRAQWPSGWSCRSRPKKNLHHVNLPLFNEASEFFNPHENRGVQIAPFWKFIWSNHQFSGVSTRWLRFNTWKAALRRGGQKACEFAEV